MLDPKRARGLPCEVLTRERAVDTKRGARTFGGCNDGELHVFDDVPGNEYAGNAGCLVAAGLDAAIPEQLATDGFGQTRLRPCRRVEEESIAAQNAAVFKCNCMQMPLGAVERMFSGSGRALVFPPLGRTRERM